jgi:hypothetical protein
VPFSFIDVSFSVVQIDLRRRSKHKRGLRPTHAAPLDLYLCEDKTQNARLSIAQCGAWGARLQSVFCGCGARVARRCSGTRCALGLMARDSYTVLAAGLALWAGCARFFLIWNEYFFLRTKSLFLGFLYAAD